MLALLATVQASHGAPMVVVPHLENAIYSPLPTYAYEARKMHLSGSGLYLIRVDIKTGKVKRVTVAKTAGHKFLDQQVIYAVERWRFQAGALRPIRELLPTINDPHRDTDSILKLPVSFVLKR